ncbi:MAG: tandem-95 repeat protein [Chloroflexi bacterium SZAS-1]|nr:tandem-95 repeat protein [Chloroflexi bacterium SZAS-1]
MPKRILFIVLASLACALPAAQPARAATISVTTFADDDTTNGNCSLREAIQAANTDAAVDACAAGSGTDTISLPAGTYTLSRVGADEDLNQTGDLDIGSVVTLQGIDKNTTIIDAAGLNDRIAEVHPGAQLVLSGLALTHGGSANTPDLDGGAIFNAGALTITSADIAYNAAGRNGGAIFSAAGPVVIEHSIVRDNTAGNMNQSNGSGGGIYSSAGSVQLNDSIVNNNSSYNGYGGGIRSAELLQIESSWIHDNVTNTRGGGIYSSATAVITGTVLDSNSAGHDGGNLYSADDSQATQLIITSSELRRGHARYGGGLFNGGGLQLNSVSFALNDAQLGGGLYSTALSDTLRLTNVTMAENSHDANAAGAAITNIGAAMTVQNSLFGGNGANDSCAGPLASGGHNLDAGNSCGFASAGDLSNTDPLLGALPTINRTPGTFPLLVGSPGINAGDNATCAALDIAGRARPHGMACDIGAYETNNTPTATAETYPLAEDTQLMLAAPGLLSNDSDPDGDPLTVIQADWPTKGTLALSANGAFTYTPPAHFYGGDQFAYRVSDGALQSDVVVVSINVAPVNDPPTARPDSASTRSSAPLLIPASALLANDSDIEGDGLFLSAVSTTSQHHGALAFDGTNVRYTPPIGVSGPDVFTYTVSDGHGGSAVGTVTVDVQLKWLFLPIARR